jgi:hypothetical protein
MRPMDRIPAKLAEMDEFICADPALLGPRIRQPLLGRLLQDWQARCVNDLLPARRDFAPEQLRYVLGNLILWDLQGDPPVATYRLYGSNFAIHRSGEMTGKRLDELPDPVMRDMALYGLRCVLAERQPLLSRGRYSLSGDTVLAVETLSLPLASDGRKIDMILHGQFNNFLGYETRPAAPGSVVMQCEPVHILQGQIQDERLARLLQDWNRWRGRRSLPAQSDFQLAALDYLKDKVFLFDILPQPGDAMPRFRYRVFGSGIAAFRGFDLTGSCIDEHPDGAFAARAQLAYAQAVARRLPLRAKVDAPGSSGLHSRFEALILPLATDGETPDMVLAGQVMSEA